MSEFVEIRASIEIVEEAYEYMLAYAAQGRSDEGAGPDGAHIRSFLTRFADAAMAMTPMVRELANDNPSDCDAILDSFERDTNTVVAMLRLLHTSDNVSSEMIDNTNGTIVMRSYLTTLFFIDKVLLPTQRGPET